MKAFTLWLFGLTIVLSMFNIGWLCLMLPVLFVWLCFMGMLA
jgi:hypothetical protein